MPAGCHFAHAIDTITGQSTCFVATYSGAQGTHSLPWNPDAPRIDKWYPIWQWNYLWPTHAIPIPSHCPTAPLGSPANPYPPNPDPPEDPQPETPPSITTPGCEPATSVPPDDHSTSSQFVASGGGISGQGGGFGNGAIDQMGQPLVIGMTPMATYSSNGTPLYTHDVEIEIEEGAGGGHHVNSYHEGTGPGILCVHPPELIDYMLHGSGVNPSSRWPTELSASTLLFHNCERADASTGDNSKTYLAFGNPLSGTVKPKSGVYFDYNPSTGVLNIQHTDASGADTSVGSGVKVDGVAVGTGSGNVTTADTLTSGNVIGGNGGVDINDSGIALADLLLAADIGSTVQAYSAETMLGSNNLSELDSLDTSRSNLGVEELLARATGADVAINSTSVVNIASATDTVAAGDTYEFHLAGAVINASGADRTYTARVTIGATTFDLAFDGVTAVSGDSDGDIVFVAAEVSVVSTSLIYCTMRLRRGKDFTTGVAQIHVSANDRHQIGSSTNNETGSKTIAIGLFSSNATATQTLQLTRCVIRK